MHCPSCSKESSLDQKFCRKCGFNLEPVAKLITGSDGSEEVGLEKNEHERRLVRRMFRLISLGCAVLLVGVILLLINKGFVHELMFQYLASFFLLGGAAIAAYGVLSSILRGTYLPGKSPKSPEQINQGPATKELPEGRDPAFVQSVTERTTQLIGEDASRKS